MRFFTTFFFSLFILSLSASNYHGEIHQFRQPDGTMVDVRLYGSEYYIRAEGLDGYTLVRDENSKWICYADLSTDRSSLIPTQIHYAGIESRPTSLRNDLSMPKHLDISKEAYTQIINGNAQKLFALPDVQSVQNSYHDHKRADEVLQGSLKGLCIVIDFPDEEGDLAITEYEDLCNGLNYVKYGNNGSLRQYYQDISGGLLDYQNVVYGIFRAPKSFQEYDDMPYAQGAREILGLALEWIESQGFDFSTLSHDENNTIQAINMMYTGNPPNWAKGMWFHQGYYGDFEADGVRTGRYNTSPANAPLTIGTIVHENGHMIGRWPDTYKYDNQNGPDGIGAFDVMCATGPSTNPVLPNPYFVNRVGWGHNLDVTGFNSRLRDTSNIYSSYTYTNESNPREFYIFQSRIKTGRSAGIPDEGLTVWHIDRDGDNQSTHHETYLVHANNDNENHSGACFKSGRIPEFYYDSTPNSDWYDLNPSGLRLWNFSDRGPVMSYNIGKGPSLLVNYVNYENDENGDGHLTSGESFDINVLITNEDVALSTSSKVKCIAVGPNADLVTINNPIVEPGEIEVSGNATVTFNITIDPSAPDFTELSFRFEVEEENRTDFAVKKLLTGKIFLMDSVEVTECNAMFLDPNGLENYSNTSHFIQTFYPSDPNMKINVEWINFELESSAGCQNDFIRVYDGVDLSDPIFKKYCGSVLPPNMISTHETGALTFEFYAGINNNFSGWQAKIFCTSSVGNNKIKNDLNAQIYPNPASGNVNVSLSKIADYDIIIRDMIGREVSRHFIKNDVTTVLPMNKLSAGVYNVEITSGRSFTVKKLILQ